jgi:hypothetical protein
MKLRVACPSQTGTTQRMENKLDSKPAVLWEECSSRRSLTPPWSENGAQLRKAIAHAWFRLVLLRRFDFRQYSLGLYSAGKQSSISTETWCSTLIPSYGTVLTVPAFSPAVRSLNGFVSEPVDTQSRDSSIRLDWFSSANFFHKSSHGAGV